MIRYRKEDALHPEKDTTVELDLLPLVAFGVGFLAVRALMEIIREIEHEQSRR